VSSTTQFQHKSLSALSRNRKPGATISLLLRLLALNEEYTSFNFRVIFDSSELRTLPWALRGVEETRLRSGNQTDDDRSGSKTLAKGK
jgi:hypothetical protein